MEQLTLFNEKKSIKSNSVILSASRMTDMPKFYPNELIDEVETRLNKGKVIHTLVLWSKHPDSLLKDPLYSYLLHLKKRGVQLYFQCTITGMGSLDIENSGFMLEENVPNPEKALKDLERVIGLLESPELVKLRIDPIVRLRNKKTNEVFSNIKFAEEIIKRTSQLGVKTYTFSFLEPSIYNKVDRRFTRYAWDMMTITQAERERVYEWFKEKGKQYNVTIEACCVRGLTQSRCLDGVELERLKEGDEVVDKKEPRKREQCACTTSIDIGGWPPKKCYSKCKYCYANVSL